jgi:hypothetical protein
LKYFTNQKSQKIMAKFDEIKNLVMGLEGDFDKFYKHRMTLEEKDKVH